MLGLTGTTNARELLKKHKLKLWAGIIKVVGPAAHPIPDLFGKGELILSSAYALPNIGYSDIRQITVHYFIA